MAGGVAQDLSCSWTSERRKVFVSRKVKTTVSNRCKRKSRSLCLGESGEGKAIRKEGTESEREVREIRKALKVPSPCDLALQV